MHETVATPQHKNIEQACILVNFVGQLKNLGIAQKCVYLQIFIRLTLVNLTAEQTRLGLDKTKFFQRPTCFLFTV